MTNRALTRFAGLLLGLSVAGCQDADARIPIDSMTLYSLDAEHELGLDEKPTGETFHNYPVLGKTDVADPKDHTAILVAIKKGIAQSDGKLINCFWPRHGVRLVQDGKTIEYVICFECSQLDEYRDGGRSHKTTTGSPAPLLDQHLESAGVPQQKRGKSALGADG
jgi:hypothetical protein